jgi:hypothetical protein
MVQMQKNGRRQKREEGPAESPNSIIPLGQGPTYLDEQSGSDYSPRTRKVKSIATSRLHRYVSEFKNVKFSFVRNVENLSSYSNILTLHNTEAEVGKLPPFSA